MKNPAFSNSRLRSQRGFSMLAIAIFAVAVLSAVLISYKAMKKSTEVGRMRSLLATSDVTKRTDVESLSTFLFNHEGVGGTCVVTGVIDASGTASITGTSTGHTDNCPNAADFNLPGNGRNLNFVGYTITTSSGEVVRGYHLIQDQVPGNGPPAQEPPSCFPGSTLVLVSSTAGVNSYRRIDSFRSGDVVMALADVSSALERLSYHQLSAQRRQRASSQLMLDAAPVQIAGLIVHDPATENAVRLGLSSGVLVTTPSHPFFAIGRGWIHAGQLRIGDQLTSFDRSIVTVKHVSEENPPAVLYNLHLAEDHTYFVLPEGSRSPVLVHNATTQKMEGGGAF